MWGLTYVDAYADGVKTRYSFRYIPHLVIADGNGKQLEAIEAQELLSLFQNKTMVADVTERARAWLKKDDAGS